MELHDVKKKVKTFYSTAEVADFMGLPYMQVYRLIKCGKIKATNIALSGTKPIFGVKPEDLQAYYDQIPHPDNGVKSID